MMIIIIIIVIIIIVIIVIHSVSQRGHAITRLQLQSGEIQTNSKQKTLTKSSRETFDTILKQSRTVSYAHDLTRLTRQNYETDDTPGA